MIQHEDLRGCFQQTHFWLHSQFHTQPCKSCQTPAMESHPYTRWSIGKHQPRGWENIPPLGTVQHYPLSPHLEFRVTEVGEKLILKLLEMFFLTSQSLCFPSTMQGTVPWWESPSATENQGIISQK